MKTIIHQLQRTIAKTLLALCVALPISFAHAAQPEIIRVDETSIDETLSEHCGFPVQVHLEAKIIFNSRDNSVSVTGPYK